MILSRIFRPFQLASRDSHRLYVKLSILIVSINYFPGLRSDLTTEKQSSISERKCYHGAGQLSSTAGKAGARIKGLTFDTHKWRA